jgi:3-oxoacyl-[acyl-carrier-protein] synthase II
VTGTGSQIAVTGLGAIASNGHSAAEIWANCLAGVSGIARFRDMDCTGIEVDFGGEITDFDFEPWVSQRDRLNFDPSQLYATAASAMALDDAGESARAYDPARIGVVIGTGAGPVRTHSANWQAAERAGPTAVSAYYPASATVSLAASLPAMSLGLRGPTFGASGACATAVYNLVGASHLLAAGDADLVLAGAVDATVLPTAVAGFANMRGLARHAEPARASRPLDRDRNGLVLAEGCAVVALERLDAALRRGARIYGVLAGYGLTGSAGSVLAADADGIARACHLALARAGLRPEEVEHVNLHAAGTRQGDLVEAQALHDVLGERAATIPVTAPKSLLGHAMGAAAGLETVLLLKTLETGWIPPTINLDMPDPEIDLSASTVPVRALVRTAMKTSFGLGGLNAALVFRRADEP